MTVERPGKLMAFVGTRPCGCLCYYNVDVGDRDLIGRSITDAIRCGAQIKYVDAALSLEQIEQTMLGCHECEPLFHPEPPEPIEPEEPSEAEEAMQL